jgi:hypothetical protein
LLAFPTEALGLLCNISTEPKLKQMILNETELVVTVAAICGISTKSLDVERSSGFLINLLTSPTNQEKLMDLYENI